MPDVMEKSIADEVGIVMKTLVGNGVPFDQAATVAHRAEVAYKRALIAADDLEKVEREETYGKRPMTARNGR